MSEDEERPRARPGRSGRAQRDLTASEAAAFLRVSVATVRLWADAGKLPSHRTPGRHRRFVEEDLLRWLAERGASPPESRRLRRMPQEVPACPLLARELNARTEAVIARVLEGYDDDVPTPLPAPSEPAARRLTTRFLRVITQGLESGRPGTAAGRAELAGVRGGSQGATGARVIAEHTRVVGAVLAEADAVRRDGVPIEALAIPSLCAVIDHVQTAVVQGFEQAHTLRAPLPPATR